MFPHFQKIAKFRHDLSLEAGFSVIVHHMPSFSATYVALSQHHPCVGVCVCVCVGVCVCGECSTRYLILCCHSCMGPTPSVFKPPITWMIDVWGRCCPLRWQHTPHKHYIVSAGVCQSMTVSLLIAMHFYGTTAYQLLISCISCRSVHPLHL
jgi:hypothetical protein